MKFLNISKLDAEGTARNRPIWALNTASTSDVRHEGEILLQIRSAAGGPPDPLRIDQTWLPQELTLNITRKRLLESSEFRRAVSSGLVSLVSSSTAQRMLEQEGAREEQKRISAVRQSVREAGMARTISKKLVDVTRADGQDDDEEEHGRNKTVVMGFDDEDDDAPSSTKVQSTAVEDVEPGISPKFKMWVDKMNATATDIGCKNEIRGRQSYKVAQLSYLSRKLDRKFESSLKTVNKALARAKG